MKRNAEAAAGPPEGVLEIRLAVTRWKVYTGKTQRDLAAELGIPPSYLCQILNGQRPGRRYVARIAEITRPFAS